jgi:hypothetical protein
MDLGTKMAVFGPGQPVTEIGVSHAGVQSSAVQHCHRDCLMRLLRKTIAAGNEQNRAALRDPELR